MTWSSLDALKQIEALMDEGVEWREACKAVMHGKGSDPAPPSTNMDAWYNARCAGDDDERFDC